MARTNFDEMMMMQASKWTKYKKLVAKDKVKAQK
jgi:hypothetical protein